MPSRFIVKQYAPDSYYHIYSRGVDKQPIFLDEDDYIVFMSFLKRYLSRESQHDKSGRAYPNYHDQLELLAFCLMGNHFHLFVYQHDAHAITNLMRSLLTSYTIYFNRDHKRIGTLFQSHYHASRIDSEAYLLHISRYIHLNPGDYRHYPYSSYPYYIGQKQSDWVRPERILSLFGNSKDYEQFVADFENYKHTLDLVKDELAT